MQDGLARNAAKGSTTIEKEQSPSDLLARDSEMVSSRWYNRPSPTGMIYANLRSISIVILLTASKASHALKKPYHVEWTANRIDRSTMASDIIVSCGCTSSDGNMHRGSEVHAHGYWHSMKIRWLLCN